MYISYYNVNYLPNTFMINVYIICICIGCTLEKDLISIIPLYDDVDSILFYVFTFSGIGSTNRETNKLKYKRCTHKNKYPFCLMYIHNVYK